MTVKNHYSSFKEFSKAMQEVMSFMKENQRIEAFTKFIHYL